MQGQTTSAVARAGKDIGFRSPIASASARPVRSSRTNPAERRLHRQFRNLTRKHLGRLFDRLFAEYTGLHFHIAWAPTASLEWGAGTLPTACSVCCRLAGTTLAAQPICRVCGPKQLARALAWNRRGLQFICRLGVQNYWLPVSVRGVAVSIAYLQALDRRRPGQASPRANAHAARMLDRSDFNRACRLLRLMMQHVQTASLADLRKADLTSAGHAVIALEKEQARLHEALQRHLPAPPLATRRPGLETHTDQAVQCLLDCISRDYAKPITLRQCAGKLGMNAAYLSALFSRAVGRPFKTHLTELRMEKARALLNDPGKTASEVAAAVGYASENRFRIAFKKATGLSPKLWRETMQTNPPPQ